MIQTSSRLMCKSQHLQHMMNVIGANLIKDLFADVFGIKPTQENLNLIEYSQISSGKRTCRVISFLGIPFALFIITKVKTFTGLTILKEDGI